MTALSKPMISVLLQLSAGPQPPSIARSVATLRVLERRGFIRRVSYAHVGLSSGRIRMTLAGRRALDRADPKRIRAVQESMPC